MLKPTLRVERALWRAGARRVAGVDEVGMACLAGPVVVGAVVLRPNCRMIAGVRDSKTLSLPQRERLFARILARALAVGVGAATVAEIEQLNILRASHLAMWRALRRVQPYDHALIDGREIRDVDLGPHTAIVDGDASSYAIASASIVAKVLRDRLMVRLARRYPHYGWDENVGYPTRRHREGLRLHGVSPLHRRTFGSVRLLLQSQSQLAMDFLAPALADSIGEVGGADDAVAPVLAGS